MRIEEHPVLGTFEKGSKVQFSFDGQSMEGFEGEPIAIALSSIFQFDPPGACFAPSAAARIALWSSTAN